MPCTALEPLEPGQTSETVFGFQEFRSLMMEQGILNQSEVDNIFRMMLVIQKFCGFSSALPPKSPRKPPSLDIQRTSQLLAKNRSFTPSNMTRRRRGFDMLESMVVMGCVGSTGGFAREGNLSDDPTWFWWDADDPLR